MRAHSTPAKNYRLITTLCFLGFGIVVALITSVINYKSSFTDIERSLQQMSQSEYQFKHGVLSNYISKFELLLGSIAQNELALNYLKSQAPGDRHNLTNLFYALAYENRDIMQLRYIDVSGKEAIRIDRETGKQEPWVVSDEQLQDKSQRDYFKQTLTMESGRFWHSKVDLNIEHGAIEIPLRPTLRIATPLYVGGQLKGILIVNLLFSNTLDGLVHSANFDISLIDEDGEILHHALADRSWSRYLNLKIKAFDLFPAEASYLVRQDVYHAPRLSSYNLGDVFRNGEQLRLIFTPKKVVVEEMHSTNILSALLIAITIMVVSIPLSWLISQIPSRLQSELSNAYESSRKDAEILDKFVMISKTDINGMITDVSTCLTQTSGYSADELIGKHHNVLAHPDTSGQHYARLWKTVLKGKVWEGEINELDKNGNDLWVHSVITPEYNSSAEIVGFTAILQNITDKKLIEKMSNIDKLTGLLNRNRLNDVLITEMARFDRFNNSFSIIMLDIDHFKKVNDNYGHQVGDEVLIQISNIFKSNSRITDGVYRWGGEEFIIVASGLELHQAMVFADKLRTLVDNFVFPGIGHLTISCGVAECQHGKTSEQLLSRADIALYQAKHSGRNKVVAAAFDTEKTAGPTPLKSLL